MIRKSTKRSDTSYTIYVCDTCGKESVRGIPQCPICNRHVCCEDFIGYLNIRSVYPELICQNCMKVFNEKYKQRADAIYDQLHEIEHAFDALVEEFKHFRRET